MKILFISFPLCHKRISSIENLIGSGKPPPHSETFRSKKYRQQIKNTAEKMKPNSIKSVNPDGENREQARELREAFIQPEEVEGLSHYLAYEVESVQCPVHGEMESRSPVAELDGRIYAPPEGLRLYYCPECCQQLTNDVGRRPRGHIASKAVWLMFASENRKKIERYFIEVGSLNEEGEESVEGWFRSWTEEGRK